MAGLSSAQDPPPRGPSWSDPSPALGPRLSPTLISLRMGAEALLGPGTGLRLLEAGLPATKPVGGPRCPQSPVWENPDHPERAPAGLLSPGPRTMHGSERRLPGGATTTGQRFAFVPNEQLSLKP